MSNRIPLDLIEVQSPCSQNWNRMSGTDQKRYCDHCNTYVHDFSTMTEADVQNLICQQAGNLCVRFTRLPNGKIQTLDYAPPSAARRYGWLWIVLIAIAGALGIVEKRLTTPPVMMGGPRVPFPAATTNPVQPPPCQTPSDVLE